MENHSLLIFLREKKINGPGCVSKKVSLMLSYNGNCHLLAKRFSTDKCSVNGIVQYF